MKPGFITVGSKCDLSK